MREPRHQVLPYLASPNNTSKNCSPFEQLDAHVLDHQVQKLWMAITKSDSKQNVQHHRCQMAALEISFRPLVAMSFFSSDD